MAEVATAPRPPPPGRNTRRPLRDGQRRPPPRSGSSSGSVEQFFKKHLEKTAERALSPFRGGGGSGRVSDATSKVTTGPNNDRNKSSSSRSSPNVKSPTRERREPESRLSSRNRPEAANRGSEDDKRSVTPTRNSTASSMKNTKMLTPPPRTSSLQQGVTSLYNNSKLRELFQKRHQSKDASDDDMEDDLDDDYEDEGSAPNVSYTNARPSCIDSEWLIAGSSRELKGLGDSVAWGDFKDDYLEDNNNKTTPARWSLFANKNNNSTLRSSTASSASSGTRPQRVSTASSKSASAAVRFETSTRVAYTFHLDEYTDEEYYAVWWNSEEIQKCLEKCRTIVWKMEDAERQERMSSKNKKYCVRGLENFTEMGHRIHCMYREAGWIAVLEGQRDSSVEDVAERYARAGRACQKAAVRRAEEDEKVARQIHAKENYSKETYSKSTPLPTIPDAPTPTTPANRKKKKRSVSPKKDSNN